MANEKCKELSKSAKLQFESALGISFSKWYISGCREDLKPCHRGFIIPERLEAARRPLRDRISIERFAVPSGGGRDECRRMCRPQGRRNLIHCPPYPVSLSLALSCMISLLPFPPSLSPSPPPLSFSLHCCNLPLCSPHFLHPRWNPIVSLSMVVPPPPRVFN